MERGFKTIKQLTAFWREQNQSQMTAHWADSLNKYTKAGFQINADYFDSVCQK